MAEFFKTRWITLISRDGCYWRILSDGLLDSATLNTDELNAALEQLDSQGWKQVGRFDNQPGEIQKIDLYFRKEINQPQHTAFSINPRFPLIEICSSATRGIRLILPGDSPGFGAGSRCCRDLRNARRAPAARDGFPLR